MSEESTPPDSEAPDEYLARVDAYLATLDFAGCEDVRLPAADFDGLLRKAIVDALPPGAGMCFNYDGDQAVVTISRPGDTRQVMTAARHSLGR